MCGIIFLKSRQKVCSENHISCWQGHIFIYVHAHTWMLLKGTVESLVRKEGVETLFSTAQMADLEANLKLWLTRHSVKAAQPL